MQEAMAGVTGIDQSNDPIRADYVAWLETADPDNRLDDYQRAALFARRTPTPKDNEHG